MLTTASQPTRYQNICLITIGKIFNRVMQIFAILLFLDKKFIPRY